MPRFYSGVTLIFYICQCISQVVKCDLFLCFHDTCLNFQNKDINKIENQLNDDFCNICDWFVDNKISIHLMCIRQNQYF